MRWASIFRMPPVRVASILTLTIFFSGCSAQPPSAPANTAKTVPAASNSGAALVTGTAAAGAIITLEPTVPRELPPPAHASLMDQFGQQFLPDLVTARVGQQVEFRSSEDVLHNVRVDHAETGEPIFNIATPSFSSYMHVFDKPGYYKVSCDVHPAMRASIFVASTPYVAVTDARGSFVVADVEAGPYRVRVIDGDRTSEQMVTVSAPRTELALAHR